MLEIVFHMPKLPITFGCQLVLYITSYILGVTNLVEYSNWRNIDEAESPAAKIPQTRDVDEFPFVAGYRVGEGFDEGIGVDEIAGPLCAGFGMTGGGILELRRAAIAFWSLRDGRYGQKDRP